VSISILYFYLGQGQDYVYEYEGKFVGRHLKDILQLNTWQKEKFNISEVGDIFPKYYILKVNNFNDIAHDTLDEWIYFLKNSEVPENFTAKGLKEAGEKLRIDQLSEAERKEYENYKESRWIEKDVIETAERKGEQKGKIEGKIEIAKNAILEGFDNQVISKLTGLTLEQIEALRAEMK
jgi:predicted transposase/invertase (TIGR01784 family)